MVTDRQSLRVCECAALLSLCGKRSLTAARVDLDLRRRNGALRINRRYWRGIRVTTIGSMGNQQAVRQPTLYTTAFRSPQLELIGFDDEQWRNFNGIPPETTPSV